MEPEELVNLLPKDGEAYLFTNFFSASECEKYYNSTKKDIVWKHEPIKLFGKEILQPRLTAWIGDPQKNISYSGITMKPQAWTKALLEIKRKVQVQAGVQFNGALLNMYRDGKDSMGWHRDNEKELGKLPVIASVSFGATRSFLFKHAVQKDLKVKIELTSGSLLIMKGETQTNWFHAIAKTTQEIGPRLNLTFRDIQS